MTDDTEIKVAVLEERQDSIISEIRAYKAETKADISKGVTTLIVVLGGIISIWAVIGFSLLGLLITRAGNSNPPVIIHYPPAAQAPAESAGTLDTES